MSERDELRRVGPDSNDWIGKRGVGKDWIGGMN